MCRRAGGDAEEYEIGAKGIMPLPKMYVHGRVGFAKGSRPYGSFILFKRHHLSARPTNTLRW